MATSSAIVEGDRNVVITAETNNSVIITGDGNTVHMHHSPEGALLEHEYRWNRPRTRPRTDPPLAPPRFDRHVDRDDEIRRLVGEDGAPRVVNVYGSQGLGKTYVLVEALNCPDVEMRDGTIYLDARGRDAEDILHAIFGELFDSPVPIRDLRVERHLSNRRAVVALEDVELAADGAQRLALGAPRCRLFVTSRQRVLFDGVAVQLEGLAQEHVPAIAEQELGRPLSGPERAAAEAVGAALRGHPLQLRQTFNRVREQGLSLESLAPRAASAAERGAELSAPQRDVARTLAVHGTAPLGLEHIQALAGGPARVAARELEARHDARSHSPRYSLVGELAEAFDDLDPELDRALEYFIGWAESEAAAGRRERVLAEGAALVELLTRVHRAGRHPEVVRLGVAIEWPLAWGNRWSAWGQVLDLVLASARASENRWAEGWAMHQLGTRQYGLGNGSVAVTGLKQALALRERIGDGAGADATRQNLRVAAGPPPLLHRLSHLSVAVVAVMTVLLIGAAGVAGAQILGGGDAAGPALVLSVQGKGAVVSDDESIRCAEAACREELDSGSRVLLRAEPQRGWQFSRWSGACSGRGPCRLVVKTDTSVTALFKRVGDPRDVTVRVDGRGTVVSYPAGISCGADKECRATFKRSGELQLTAAAARGHRFAGWSGDCDGVRPCVVKGDERAVAAGARFVADGDARSLTVLTRGVGAGRVVSSTSGIDCGELCTASFRRGTRVVLTAIPQRGSSFPGWTDPACAPATGDTCTITLKSTRDVVVRFNHVAAPPRAQSHELEVLVRGKAGTISSEPAGIESCDGRCAESLREGEVVLTASAPEGYRLGEWGRACAGTEADVCRLTLDKPLTVLAIFKRDDQKPEPTPTYTLTTRVEGAGGSIQPDCSSGCAYDAGERVTLTADNGADSFFSRWELGCPTDPETRTCTITMDADHEVIAEFGPG
ncbi:MAG: hypothetical protein M3401_15420 [Actinomycetota bacterium]|nr:hypothetical protein [Actinomycetota bacterium]